MEGIIKFHCDWTHKDENYLFPDQLCEINSWRDKLLHNELIGSHQNGVGYGNISIRYNNSDHFVITGSQTGHLSKLDFDHFALVTSYNIKDNYLRCTGAIKASSESLSHAAFYKVNKSIKAVIHVHSMELWKSMMFKFPSTDPEYKYGTVQLAENIESVLINNRNASPNIVIMGGHPEGIIVGDCSLDKAATYILDLKNKS